MDLEGIILSEVTQSQKNQELTLYVLTDKWILTQKLRIPKTQFAKHKKIKKNKNQREDPSFLPRMGSKIPMEGVTETKFRAERVEKTIQSLPHLGIHPINNHQTRHYCRCQ